MIHFRLNRLFHPVSRRCFDVAIDHGFFNEHAFLTGIERSAIAETLFQLKLKCRTGVCPRGAQVRTVRPLAQSAFVEEDEGAPLPARFFLMRGVNQAAASATIIRWLTVRKSLQRPMQPAARSTGASNQ